jgi:phosphocarrier protein
MDGKSIMGILLLAAAAGSALTVSTDGADEHAALEALCGFIESGFGEDTCSA